MKKEVTEEERAEMTRVLGCEPRELDGELLVTTSDLLDATNLFRLYKRVATLEAALQELLKPQAPIEPPPPVPRKRGTGK